MTNKAVIIRAVRDQVCADKYMGVEQYFVKKDKALNLETLEQKLKTCKKCGLYKTRKNCHDPESPEGS